MKLMRTIRDLTADRAWPVLGAALATQCSVNLLMRRCCEQLRQNECKMASAFGSPRAGSRALATVYDQLQIVQWRLVTGGDIITRLQKLGNFHVGRRDALSEESYREGHYLYL